MNFNRLTKVLLWNIINSKKQIIRKTIGISLALLLIIFVNCGWKLLTHSEYIVDDIHNAARISVIALGFALLVCASKVCWNMATKTDFFNYAMLPATNAEKFVANVTYQFLVRCLMMLIAIVTADATQFIASLIAGSATTSFTLAVFHHACYFADLISVGIFIHASYTLGGTFFRKHQFLYTSLLWFVIPTALGTLTTAVLGGIGYWVSQNDYIVSVNWLVGETTVGIIAEVVVLALAAGFYYLAFRTFTRTQIINNRFFN